MSGQLGQALGIHFISKLLSLQPLATVELHKVDRYDFNIFKLREATNGNELEAIVPYILTKHNLIASNKIGLD